MKVLKYLIIIFLFLGCKPENTQTKESNSKPSKLDTLTSVIDLENFIYLNDTIFKKHSYKLRKIQDFVLRSKSDSLAIKIADFLVINKSYYKADFDHNGYQDLLTIGHFDKNDLMYNFVFMNYGKDSLKAVSLRSRHAFLIPRIIQENNQKLLEIYKPQMTDYGSNIFTTRKFKLIYKFDHFIEYNEKPRISKIKKIELITLGCFGECPAFDMTILEDKSAIFKPRYYNNGVKNDEDGKSILKTVISTKDFNELVDLLNYIDFSNLENSYSVPWTDDQIATLKITYDDNKIKTIEDYGLAGTYGLSRFFEMLYDLRENQDWKEN